MSDGIQTATNEQTTLFGAEQTAKPKRSSIPIYRVALVREGKMPTYESRIRSSASAYSVLQEFIADADREHFIVLMLDQKNQVIGINTVSIGALHKQHDIKQLECELSSPGVLEFSCTHRLIPASDGLETSKEEGECSMPGKGIKG